MKKVVSGTEGYAENAKFLIPKWREISFLENQKPVIHFFPQSPSDIVDIGAGVGNDASELARMGHRVVAVEPVDELRVAGIHLHDALSIEWINDSLPHLLDLHERTFDVVLISAVWMHLDAEQRKQGMKRVVQLLRRKGKLIISIRQGSAVPGRREFYVSAEETIELAAEYRLHPILNTVTESVQKSNKDAGVVWVRLVFEFT